MSGPQPAADRDPLDLLSEEFLARHRRGEPVDAEAFAAAHPEHAAALRELLPTLLALEQVKRDKAASSASGGARLQLPQLAQLGDFRIVREVGRGGMGVVFEAVQQPLHRRVALKVLPQSALLTGSQLQRFRREAQIAAQLHHSHIVPVFGSGESDGFHWYAMQFIDGQGLDRWREAQAARPPRGSGEWAARARYVARLGAQAASALHCAHQQGTLHRDVKPGNLLLDKDDHLWVTDFGLAKALEASGLTHSGDVLGTLQYMAPEQLDGRYDARSEVYALGITLYELLTLRPAFAAASKSELMAKVRSVRPEPLRRRCPELPLDLALVVEKAIAPEPPDRYPSAAAFGADLQAFLDDRPVAARRQSRAALLWRWCRRNRALAALAASTAAAVLLAAVVGWVAYVASDEALGREKAAAEALRRQAQLNASNLRLTLDAFGGVFDALVGRDPVLAVDEDPETGEQTVVSRAVVEPGDVALLQQMLQFYDKFAAQNGDNQALRFETARAWRRVGAIEARLGHHDVAANAYQEALRRYQEVTATDVTRELAALQVEIGRLEQRRGRPGDAAQRFRLALQLLEHEQAPEGRGKALRFERAQAHFLLAALGGRPGEGRPPEGRGPEARLRVDAAQELAAARELVKGLLAEEPQNAEFLALHARCLLVGGRFFAGRQAGEAEQALQIFRELVARHPLDDRFRHELCEALLGEVRRQVFESLRRGGPAAPRPAGRDGLAAAEVTLREALQHAEALVQAQPGVPEYGFLRASVLNLQGYVLRRRAQAGGVAAAAWRAEAEVKLREAAAWAEAAVAAATAAGAPAEPRALRTLATAQTTLGLLLVDLGRADEARELARALLEAVRAAGAAAGPGGGPRRWRGLELEPDAADRLFERIGAPELLQQWQQARERPDGPPRRPR